MHRDVFISALAGALVYALITIIFYNFEAGKAVWAGGFVGGLAWFCAWVVGASWLGAHR